MRDMINDDWAQLLAAPRIRARDLRRPAIPDEPGVHAWFHDAECVYVGLAGTSLRDRLATHLAITTDLSSSTLRATVALHELGVTREVARSRPPVLTVAQVAIVNEWLAGCEVSWLTQPTREEATEVKRRLRAARLPRFNLV